MAISFPARRRVRSTVVSATVAIVALAAAPERIHAEPNKQVYEKAQQYKEEALKLWERLVNIDSGTGKARGMTVFGPPAAADVLRPLLVPFAGNGVMGATATVRNWEELRQRREVRATANRLVNFDDANLRRSATR